MSQLNEFEIYFDGTNANEVMVWHQTMVMRHYRLFGEIPSWGGAIAIDPRMPALYQFDGEFFHVYPLER